MISFCGDGYIDFFGGQGTPNNQDIMSWSSANSRWERTAQSGGGGVTGSGTNNQIVKWLSQGSTIQDSLLSDDGTSVIINGAYLTIGDNSAELVQLAFNNSTGDCYVAQVIAGDSLVTGSIPGDFVIEIRSRQDIHIRNWCHNNVKYIGCEWRHLCADGR